MSRFWSTTAQKYKYEAATNLVTLLTRGALRNLKRPKMGSEKKFRIARKKIGLTYSCPKDKDENPIESSIKLLEFLENKGGHCQYIIAKELHTSGKKHYHAYVYYDERIDTIDPLFFDYEKVHPNIINPGIGWQAYCRKDKEYITNLEENPFTTALKAKSVDEAMDFLWKKRPQAMALNGDRIEKNYAKRMKVISPKEPKKYEGPWKWPMIENIESTIIMGPSNIGKTQFAKAHFKKPLLVSHADQLRSFADGDYDGIIFDDMDFNHLPRTSQIHLVDFDEDRHIHARYNASYIPAGTRKIFTCNVSPLNIRDAAIKRRVNLIELV